MKKLVFLFVLFLTGLLVSGSAGSVQASVMAAELGYLNTSPNTYVVFYKVLWDCGTSGPGNQAVQLMYQAPGCHAGGSELLVNSTVIQGYTPPCNRNCTLGGTIGQNNYAFATFAGTITLPAGCPEWVFSVTTPDWVADNMGTAGTPQMYTEALVNTQPNVSNYSVSFGAGPVLYACASQPYTWQPQVTDVENDSLVFSLEAPLETVNTPAPYKPGFSVAAPLGAGSAVQLDARTGLLTVAPNVAGNTRYALRLKVAEYRRVNGVMVKVGVTNRNMLLVAEICPPPCTPVITASSQPLTDPFVFPADVNTCYTFSLNVCDSAFLPGIYFDPDLPGIKYSITGTGQNRTATLCWQPAATRISPNPYLYSAATGRERCPRYGDITQSLLLKVVKQKIVDPGPVVITDPDLPAVSRQAIPNIITPNGDGLNDAFIIPDLPENAELQIFDRKHKLVKTFKRYRNNWNAEGMKEGVYYYILKDKETGEVSSGEISVVR